MCIITISKERVYKKVDQIMIYLQCHVFLLLVFSQANLPTGPSEFLPEFGDPGSETVTVTEGDTAVITCRIMFVNNM